MIYNDTTSAISGWGELIRFTAGYFWGGSATRPDRLDPATIDWRQAIDAIRGARGLPFVINIEGGVWEKPGANAETLGLWIDLVRTVRRVHGGPVGIYRMIPERAYFQPIRAYHGDDPDRSNYYWRLRNNRLFSLAHEIDVIYPSLYYREEDHYRVPAHWRAVVEANIQEARQYDKPVRAYISPQFEGNYTKPLVPLEEWVDRMKVVRELVEDVVLYMDNKMPCPPEYAEAANAIFGDQAGTMIESRLP